MSRFSNGSVLIGGQPNRALTIYGTPTAAMAGSSTAFAPTIIGGTSPYTLSLASGTLPGGRSISGLTVTGTYSAAATFSYVLRVTDALGATATLAVSEVVAAAATALPAQSALVARWSADDIPAQTDNTALSAWTSGVGSFVAAQASAGLQPKYRTNQLGGKPGVQFLGGNVLDAGRPIVITSAVDSGSYTVLVFARIDGASNTAMLLSFSTAGGLNIQADGSRIGCYNFGTYPYTSSTPIGVGVVSQPSTSAWGGVSTLAEVILNGCAVIGGSSGPGSGSGNLGLGGFTTNQFTSICTMFDVLIFNRALSFAETLQAHKWWCDKYQQAYPWAGNKFYIGHGDSITAGQNESAPEYNYLSILASDKSLPLGTFTNIGIIGATWDNMNNLTGPMVDAMPAVLGPSVQIYDIAFEWYNQRSSTGNEAKASAISYLAARKNANPSIKIIFGTSTDSSDSTTQAGRVAYDNYWAANHATANNIDSYVAIHTDTNIGVAGANTNATYFGSDGIHLTGTAGTSGYRSLAVLFEAGLTALGA